MMQVPTVQTPQLAPAQPSYNAVKIDIHNPQVNVPASQPTPAPVTAPIYDNIPNASVYEVPKQSIYEPKQNFNPPPIAQEMPSVPAPVIVPPTVTTVPPTSPVVPPTVTTIPPIAPVVPSVETKKEESPVETKTEAPKSEAPAEKKDETAAPVVDAKPEVAPKIATDAAPVTATAPVQPVEVKAPEIVNPAVDVESFLGKLKNPDYEVQAGAMESIAEMAQTEPQKATSLLDVRVVDTLLGIMQNDSSKLPGPSAQQLQIREKIMSGKSVTDKEKAEANKITPMEQAERNKQYSIYTVAILQKLYGSEIEKTSNTVVPLTELPGAAGIVEQVKKNPNPMVRASSIDALSYIQRPEYKQDLTTIFTVAKKDKDVNVQQAATKALEKLAQVAEVTSTAPATEVKPADKKSA